MVVGTHSWRDQFMEAITVSAGKRVSRWAPVLLGGAGNAREGRTNTAPSTATNFWEGLCIPDLVLAVGLFYQVTSEKNLGVAGRAWLPAGFKSWLCCVTWDKLPSLHLNFLIQKGNHFDLSQQS